MEIYCQYQSHQYWHTWYWTFQYMDWQLPVRFIHLCMN